MRDPRRRPLLVLLTDGRATVAAPTGGDPRTAPAGRRLLAADGVAVGRGGLRARPRSGSGLAARAGRRPRRGVPSTSAELPPTADGVVRAARSDAIEEGSLMPQGQPRRVPQDGLTTRQRRNRPLLDGAHRRDEGEVDRGVRDGAARLEPGLGHRGVPVREVARSGRSARRARSGRSAGCTRRPARAGRSSGTRWARAGAGRARPAPRRTTPRRRSRAGGRSSAGSRRETHDLYVLDEFTYPMKWGWVDVDEVVETLADRPGHQHVVITGRDAPPSWSRPPTWSSR